MQFLIDNWYLIVGAIVLFAVLFATAYKVYNMPKDEQIRKVKSWMLWAVSVAEKEIGAGMGKVKLQYVYDKAVERFPWIDSLISFETFSTWVDEALEEMKNQLSSNSNMVKFISNK